MPSVAISCHCNHAIEMHGGTAQDGNCMVDALPALDVYRDVLLHASCMAHIEPQSDALKRHAGGQSDGGCSASI